MRPILLILAAAAAAMAQSDNNTVTITASRNVTAVPDQVVFSVILRTDPGTAPADVAGKLAAAGITAADFSSVVSDGLTGRSATLQWVFQPVVPLAKLKDTSTALAALSKQLGQRNGSAVLSYSVMYSQTSAAGQAAACTLAALVSDARREADRLATAAGMRVGAIVSLSDGSGASAVAQERIGDFSAIFDPVGGVLGGVISGMFYTVPSAYSGASGSCTLVAQFRLMP